MVVFSEPIHIFWGSCIQVVALFLKDKLLSKNDVKTLFGIHCLFQMDIAQAQRKDPINMR